MNKIILYTASEIQQIKQAGQIASQVLDLITPHVTDNVTTEYLNDLCHQYIEQKKATSASLNYQGFPKSVCISVNEEVCHGIPSKRVLRPGDIVNIDVSVIYNGWYGDTSRMFMLEPISQENRNLVESTKKALSEAIKQVKPGLPLNIIGKTIENCIKPFGYGIVRDFCGHGIGKHFHHNPKILHYNNHITTIIKPGMCFTIEPMINLGKEKVHILKDNWTVVTQDGTCSAQWEHMLAITEQGCDILTF